MLKEILYATNNKGKIIEIKKQLIYNNVNVVSPIDLDIELDVPEDGRTLEENARSKVLGFRKLKRKVGGRLILADDTGLEIDALDKEPGIHVRRWKDGKTKMSDEEIIEYCLQKMEGIPLEKRGAQFRTVLALGLPNGEIEYFDGILRGKILEKASDFRVEGFPFESLFFVNEWNMLLGDAHKLEAKDKGERINHRERALNKAIPRIKDLFS